LLAGGNDSPVSLKIERDNRVFQAKLTRSMDVLSFYNRWIRMKEKSRQIADGIYYLDFYQVTGKDIEALLPELQKARSIICDLRGYPKDTMAFIMYLLKENDTSTAWMRAPQIIYPDYEQVTYRTLGWQLEAIEPHLTARIIFIVDGRAISYAESYMSFIEHYRLATIIGQPTAGTNGNVNVIYLPGQYTVSFTGMQVVKHDGSQHHGVGIIPHIFLNRTIKGVKEGRDEFLEKAIELAAKGLDK
jgi:C-terminal processing protease CtpA/Prc